jgi:hypothetical protein
MKHPSRSLIPLVIVFAGIGVVLGAACDSPDSGPTHSSGPDAYRFGDIQATASPYTDGSLIVEGSHLPITISTESKDEKFELRIEMLGSPYDTEHYTHDKHGFRFIGTETGGTFKPAITLLRYPQDPEEERTWNGTWNVGSTSVKAAGVINVSPEKLNLALGGKATRVSVKLSFEETNLKESERTLVFWISHELGVIKREIQSADAIYLTREPAAPTSEEAP